MAELYPHNFLRKRTQQFLHGVIHKSGPVKKLNKYLWNRVSQSRLGSISPFTILENNPKLTHMKTAILLFVLMCSIVAQAQTAWTPSVMIKFKRVGGTDITADGKFTVYTISTSMMEGEKSESLTHLWVASADG